MKCKKINKSFRCCNFVVIVNPNFLFNPYYIGPKRIIRSSKPEHDYIIIYSLYKNSNIRFFENSLDLIII